jgi:hypothetical protein
MIAAATGAKPSTVRGWLAGRSEPTGTRAERLIELAEMIKRLALVVRPESIPVWLQRPILALDDEKPIELIARGCPVRRRSSWWRPGVMVTRWRA